VNNNEIVFHDVRREYGRLREKAKSFERIKQNQNAA